MPYIRFLDITKDARFVRAKNDRVCSIVYSIKAYNGEEGESIRSFSHRRGLNKCIENHRPFRCASGP